MSDSPGQLYDEAQRAKSVFRQVTANANATRAWLRIVPGIPDELRREMVADLENQQRYHARRVRDAQEASPIKDYAVYNLMSSNSNTSTKEESR